MTEFGPRPTERVKELAHALKTEIGFTTLNSSDVCAIDVSALRKRFLRQLKFFAPPS